MGTACKLTHGMQLFYEQLQAMKWQEPWDLLPLETGALFAEELASELAPGHMLEGRQFIAVARRGDCDDALFLVDNAGPYLAVVHMTWAGQREREPHFPAVTLYPSVAEFSRAMAQDHVAREEREFPGIVCTPSTLGGAPRFEGHRIDVFHAMFHLMHSANPEEYFADFGIEDLTVDDLKVATRYCRSRQCEKDQPARYCSWCTLSQRHDRYPDSVKPDAFSDGWSLADSVMKKFGWTAPPPGGSR